MTDCSVSLFDYENVANEKKKIIKGKKSEISFKDQRLKHRVEKR